jgi:hypothetical protein
MKVSKWGNSLAIRIPGDLGACPSNSRFFCWRGKRESDSVLSHEQDIPRLED